MGNAHSDFSIILAKAGGLCSYCGRKLSLNQHGTFVESGAPDGAWVVDHWTPHSGFSNPHDSEFWDNYWPTCCDCKEAKGELAGDTYILGRIERQASVNQEVLKKLMGRQFRNSLKIPSHGRLLFAR